VKTITIDHLVHREEIREPKFVKIDVDGAEGLVLEGMRETIASSKPTIEAAPTGPPQGGCSWCSGMRSGRNIKSPPEAGPE